MKRRIIEVITAITIATSFSASVNAYSELDRHFEHISKQKQFILLESSDISVDFNGDGNSNVFDLIRLKKLVLNRSNFNDIDIVDGEVRELATYTSDDLVANGVCPEGTCEGTTIRIFEVHASDGYYYKYVQVKFSGKRTPNEYIPTGYIYSESATKWIDSFLKNGISGTGYFSRWTVAAG